MLAACVIHWIDGPPTEVTRQMPEMSMVEKWFCRSALWGALARKVVVPYALQGLTPDGELLEVGGGGGAMAEAILRQHPGASLTVTDVDQAMVDSAHRRLAAFPNARVLQADATNLPFADESFDVVATFLMMHHVIHWREAIGELVRVLRPGGGLVGYDLAPTRLADVIHRVDRSPYRLVDGIEFVHALSAAGLVDVRLRRGANGQLWRATGHRLPTRNGEPV